MATTRSVLAPHGATLWLSKNTSSLDYGKAVQAAWAVVARAMPWSKLEPTQWPLVPVYHGDTRASPFVDPTWDNGVQFAVAFGFQARDDASWVAQRLRDADLGTEILGVSDPDSSHFKGLVLAQIISYRAVFFLKGSYGGDPGPNLDTGIEVIHLKEGDAKAILDATDGDFDWLGPQMMALVGRNLGRWIREPRRNEPPERFADHGLELLWAGAPNLAGVVGGLALERDLRLRLGMGGDGEKERIEQLGRLIKQAKDSGRVSTDVARRMFEFKEIRNLCAHAVAHDSETNVEREVGDFLRWFRTYLESGDGPGGGRKDRSEGG